MHNQVENVLRISKLENDELDLEKRDLNLHYILQEQMIQDFSNLNIL